MSEAATSTAPAPRARWLTTRSILSGALFTLAITIVVNLHELGHALASLVLHRSNTVWFLNHVVHDPGAVPGDAAIAYAGSAVGALLGLLALGAYLGAKPRSPTVRLFLLWMVLHGFCNLLGYMITTPFFPHADWGGAANLLGWPMLAKVAVAVAAFFLVRLLGKHLTPHLLALAPSSEELATPDARKRFLVEIAIVPWAIGVLACFLVPPEHEVSLLGPIANVVSGLPALRAYREASGASAVVPSGTTWGTRVPWILIVVTVALRVGASLLLSHGIKLN